MACYRWLGKVMSVLTDGAFDSSGGTLGAGARRRRACEQGAGEIDEPLVTFS